jgi:hypothetical protein
MLEAHPADAPEKHRTRAVQTVSPPKPHPTRSPRPSSHHRAPSHLDPSRTKLDAPRKSPPNRHPLYPPSAPRDDRTIHWSPRSPRATRQRRARREPRRVPRRPNKLLIPLYPSPTGLTPSASRPAPRGQGAREDGAERPSGREHRPQQATPAPRMRDAAMMGLAERVGFEPTVQFPVRILSKDVPSATRPPLQERGTIPRRPFACKPRFFDAKSPRFAGDSRG